MSSLGRISTFETFRSNTESITDAQRFLNRTQDQLATGKKILQPADDPVSSAQITSLNNDLARIADYQKNTDRALSTLSFSEDVIGGAEDALLRVRDLLLRSQNPVLNEQDRLPLAAEVEGILQQLVALGNTKNADGEFIFGGFASKTQPYELIGGAVIDNSFGDVGVRNVNIADGISVQVSDPGTEVFYAAPGNGAFTVQADAGNAGRASITATNASTNFDQTQDYTLTFSETAPGSGDFTYSIVGSVSGSWTGPYTTGEEIVFGNAGAEGSLKLEGNPVDGDSFEVTSNNGSVQSLFDVVVSIRNALQNSDSPEDRAIADTALNNALQSVDKNLSQLSQVRTSLGVRLNRVEDQVNLNTGFNLQLRKTVSSLEDIDYAETISALQLQLTALQAAQQTFVKTTGLTIFDYL